MITHVYWLNSSRPMLYSAYKFMRMRTRRLTVTGIMTLIGRDSYTCV